MKNLKVYDENEPVTDRGRHTGPIAVDYAALKSAMTNTTDARVLLQNGDVAKAVEQLSAAIDDLTDCLSEVVRGIKRGEIAVYNQDRDVREV
jgi:hypothetical protein